MRFVSVLAALLLVFQPALALAQQRVDGGTTPTRPSFTPIGGTDGTNDRLMRVDANGVQRVREEYPASSSAPVLFNMATGYDLSTTATITEIGTAWPSAGDYYHKGLVIGVNMQTEAAAGVDVFLEVSHTGSGNYNLVIYKNAAGVEDTVSWKFTTDTPDTTAGLGLWCAIPVEAQNVVNAAQYWRASARSPASNGHATFWISAVGKR